jgi:transposase
VLVKPYTAIYLYPIILLLIFPAPRCSFRIILLLKRRFELTPREKEKLEKWFAAVPEFKLAYDTKERGYDIWAYANSSRDAEDRFENWSDRIPKEVESAFREFLSMVKRWGRHIFNFFDYRFTNAFTESKNRDIKSLQRHGRRTSFVVLRARVLYLSTTRKEPKPKEEITIKCIREAMKFEEDK